MFKPKIILFGANGFLGTKILALKPKEVELWAISRNAPNKKEKNKQIKLDLLDIKLLENIFKRIKPQLVIHAARIEPFDTNPIKVKKFTQELVKVIKLVGAKLIYISSDAVFDGRKGNYKESDKPAPLTDYGKAKLAAENVIKKHLKNYLIIRASYIYGKSNGNWDKRTNELIRQIRKNQPVYRFKDMYRCPILVDDLAKAVWHLAKIDFCGIVHVAGKKKSVWQFSREVSKKIGFNPKIIKPDYLKTKNLKIAADTSLNTDLAKKLGLNL